MNKKTITILFTLTLLVLMSTAVFADPIVICQGKVCHKVNYGRVTKITLKRESFKIQFPSQCYLPEEDSFYAAKIAAFDDSTLFNALNNGQSDYEIVPFAPGTGAATMGPYPSLYLSDESHHYIIYHPDMKDYQRADLVTRDDINLTLSWTINSVDNGNGPISLSEYPGNELYILIYLPQDDDHIVQKNEWAKIRVKLR